MRQARAADRQEIAALLDACHLPTAGFVDHLHEFLVAERGGGIAGSAGLEVCGRCALLRSVAVRPGERSDGLGQELVHRLLDAAHARGLAEVYLLTETAEPFFLRFGFITVERASAPPALAASAEFQGACGESAVLMRLSLARPPVLVRRARGDDAPAITRIYNQGIEDRTATLETEIRTAEERLRWLAARSGRHPVVVAVRQGETVGWASLNPFNPRAAYRWVADFSVYVDRAHRGSGLGTLLVRELERRARDLGYHKLVLTTFPFSPAVHLYEKLQYRQVGIYREQGQLDGRWVDTLVMEKLLETEA
jgi:L-amino acid N-acyltransferase YncA